MNQFPQYNNPFFRESLRPLKADVHHLKDRRYKPTVEAIYYKRSQDPETEITSKLPPEISIKKSKSKERANKFNRTNAKIEEKEDEYIDFQNYEQQFKDLQMRIQQIREKSAIYPVWASDSPSIPNKISRKISELNQQMFSLKKCFISPEEIMLDNNAIIIQRFWRKIYNRQIFKRSQMSLLRYKTRELSNVYRTLNSWLAQMEYFDSQAQQLRYKSISRFSILALNYWQKWAVKESIKSSHIEAKANEFYTKNILNKRIHKILQNWCDVATGPRSRKSLGKWRQSMIPIMKLELESNNISIPLNFHELVIAYVSLKSKRTFLFSVFRAWRSIFSSKSMRQKLISRNALIFRKTQLLRYGFRNWHNTVCETKTFLGSKEKYSKYLNLMKRVFSSETSRAKYILKKWSRYATIQISVRSKTQTKSRFLIKNAFLGWKNTTERNREILINTILIWKQYIQDPKINIFRNWNLYTIKRKVHREVLTRLDASYQRWHNKFQLEIFFGNWQLKLHQRSNASSSISFERKRWQLQSAKRRTTQLREQYVKGRDAVMELENELGKITSEFIASEEEVTKLEELSTSWRIALQTMKMELTRIGLTVQMCEKNENVRKRRFSNDMNENELSGNKRNILETLKIDDKILGNWKRRNSDPEMDDAVDIVKVKPTFV